MVRTAIQSDGSAVIRIGVADWIKAIVILVACFYGHAKLQCSKIDAVTQSLKTLSTRVTVAEQGIDNAQASHRELKQDFKETTRELRQTLASIDAYLRSTGK